MKVPIEITYRHMERVDEIDRLIHQKVAKLDRLFGNLISCRVAIERPQTAQRSGNPYRVRIGLTAPPGHELVVRREPVDNDMHATLRTVVIDAFKAMRRQLEELRERQRGEVKRHDEQPRAVVARIFRGAGYGFLRTAEGREIYFHRNAVLDRWDELEVGAEVRFEETEGAEGPQASTVAMLSRPGGVSRAGGGETRAPTTAG